MPTVSTTMPVLLLALAPVLTTTLDPVLAPG
jgi:hypothetical protein